VDAVSALDPWQAFRERLDRRVFGRAAEPVRVDLAPDDPAARAVRPVPMAPHGSTHCMRGEICGTTHPLKGEHLVTAQPAIEWTSPLGRLV
jgi:hypothetical protein